MPPHRPVEVRFWEKVVKGPGCWSWTSSTSEKGGYGFLSDRGEKVYAHRLSWELHRGPIPVGLWVLHSCDNPPCCNPEHLFLGTRTDNMQDAARKGRCCTIGQSRKKTCSAGHWLDNGCRDTRGHRFCRQCRNARRRQLAAARRRHGRGWSDAG